MFGSAFCFFMIGVTTPCLQADGNMPCARDKFVILVIGPTSLSMQVLSNAVYSGSRVHDFVRDDMMIHRTLSGVTSWNLLNEDDRCHESNL